MKEFLNKAKPIFMPLRGILLFIGITLLIHYSFRWWAYDFNFFPFQEPVSQLRIWMSEAAFIHTSFVMDFLGYTFEGRNNTIVFENGDWLAINSGCSGFKQLLQALFLFMLYPGKLKHKFWFLPLSMVLMHFANIIRLTGVALTLFYFPEWWDLSHDYVFRFVFYLILFLLWIWWEEKFNPRFKSMRNVIH